MIHGLELIVRPLGTVWEAGLEGEYFYAGLTDKIAIENWKKKNGEKLGIDTETQEYAVVLPLKEHED